jgi:hypothetical protein
MALSRKYVTVARTNCGPDVFGLAGFLRDDDLICHDGPRGRIAGWKEPIIQCGRFSYYPTPNLIGGARRCESLVSTFMSANFHTGSGSSALMTLTRLLAVDRPRIPVVGQCIG